MFHNLNFPGALLLLCCTLWGWRAFLSSSSSSSQNFTSISLYLARGSVLQPLIFYLVADSCNSFRCFMSSSGSPAQQRHQQTGDQRRATNETGAWIQGEAETNGFVQPGEEKSKQWFNCCWLLFGQDYKKRWSQTFAETHINKTRGNLLQTKFWLDRRKKLFS